MVHGLERITEMNESIEDFEKVVRLRILVLRAWRPLRAYKFGWYLLGIVLGMKFIPK